MNFKESYRKLPIHKGPFNSPEWLDLVCGEDGWDVIGISKGHKIAFLPFASNHSRITTPAMSGHLIVLDESGNEQKDHNILMLLAEELGNKPYLNLKIWMEDFSPLVLQNLKPTPKITFVINERSPEIIESNYEKDLRNRIKKSAKLGISVKTATTDEIHHFLNILEDNFKSKKIPLPLSRNSLEKVISKTISYGAGKLLLAQKDNELHGGIFLLSDQDRTCYLLGATSTDGRKTHANSLLLHEAIKETALNGRTFDFEGSSIPGIYIFFRDFGGKALPVWRVLKKPPMVKRIRFRFGL